MVQTNSQAYLTALLILVAAILSGCKTVPWKKGDKDEPVDAVGEAAMKIPVGTVHLVSPGGDFVLIRSSRFIPVEPGTILTSHSNGGMETATLKVSPARKGSFVTADIVSGIPQVGDHALMDHTARRTSPEDEAASGRDEIQVLE